MSGPGGGQVRTTIYYGPWQCNQRWMEHCQTQCASEGHKLMGCMWLADIKTDWQGRYLGPSLAAGGRYAITHCCCDYPLTKDTAVRRQQWKGARDSFRKKWGEEFGDWPKSGDEYWPGHHIRDLQRGGDATHKRNVLPAPPDVHDVFTDSPTHRLRPSRSKRSSGGWAGTWIQNCALSTCTVTAQPCSGGARKWAVPAGTGPSNR